MTNRLALDAQTIAQTIEALKVSYPELADDEESWLLTLASETDLVELLRKIERVRREAEANNKSLVSIIRDYRLRKFRLKKREKIMRELALKLLYVARPNGPVEFPEATYSMRNVPPSVVITDEDALPDAACKFKREPDRTAIKDMLQIGPVEGACMSNGGKTLSIRIK